MSGLTVIQKGKVSGGRPQGCNNVCIMAKIRVETIPKSTDRCDGKLIKGGNQQRAW